MLTIKNVLLAGILLLNIMSCNHKKGVYDAVQNELDKHLQPNDSGLNIMQKGNTLVLWHSETQGIDRSRYPLPEYRKEIDNTYFRLSEKKDFNDPDEAGGSAFYLEIYEAIKTGETEIKIYQREVAAESEQEDNVSLSTDTFLLIKSYRFQIE